MNQSMRKINGLIDGLITHSPTGSSREKSAIGDMLVICAALDLVPSLQRPKLTYNDTKTSNLPTDASSAVDTNVDRHDDAKMKLLELEL